MVDWNSAQYYEKTHWKNAKSKILSNVYRQRIHYRSMNLQKYISRHYILNNNNVILEIGGGATQLIDYFPGQHKHAIDPLADFYKKEFPDVISNNIELLNAKAESIPYAGEYFDLIIVRNVLDHVESISNVLGEIKRVCKTGGIIYIGLNIFSGPLYYYKLLFKDKEHPYTFNEKEILRHIECNNFTILDKLQDDEDQMKHFEELESNQILKKYLRKLFLCMNNYHFIEFVLQKPK